MKNTEALDRLDQTHGAYIDKLIWIAGNTENRELQEIVDDFSDNDWKTTFPEIYNSEYFQESKEEITETFLDFQKFGFLARIHFPKCSSFDLDKNGKPQSFRINHSICRVRYVYAETLEDLISQIEKLSEVVLQEYITEEKAKLENNAN